tara:strand:+ start:6266 stop:8089 length:1824 start_codon:yes stop_codon:yes gene_type:complete
MKNILILMCLMPLVLLAETQSAASHGNQTDRLNSWLDQEFVKYLEFYPQTKKRYGINSDYDKLNDVSVAHQAKLLEWRRKSVAEMERTFDRTQLTDQGKISYDLWNYLLTRREAAEPYVYHGYIFGRRGPHTSLPRTLISGHKVDSQADLDAYIAKLNQVDRYLGQYLTRAKTAAERGIRAPYFDYELASSQSKKVIAGAPFSEGSDTALWADVKKKINKLVTSGKIDAEAGDRYRETARTALLTSVQPAYEKLISWLDTDIKNSDSVARGAGALPDGDAYYQTALNRNTTLSMTASEIHKIGLKEVARLHREMAVIKDTVGFDGDLKAFFAYVRDSDEFYFPSTDAGREEYLALARQYLAAMQKKLPEYFGVLPKMALDVKRVEPYREQAGGSAHYVRGDTDGSKPGVFYVHLVDMRAAAVYRLENLAYHEGLPGHHMQIAIQQEIKGLPKFRSHHGYTAFSEGWGLYSEYLGKEMGFYNSPYNDFGRLSGELWRSIRLVVDTGIHSKGWTAKKATQYALDNSPYPEVKARAEIRRYFNNPGQATAYKIGMIKIMELRRYAEKQLGDRFDIRSFHDTVIGAGPLPLKVLERRVKEWVKAQAAGTQT